MQILKKLKNWELTNGFFYKDGRGFEVDLLAQKAKKVPFEFDIILTE